MALDTKAVMDKIASITYHISKIPGQEPRHTICYITTIKGSIAMGESCCKDEKDFDTGIGQNESYKRAVNKLFELEAYHQKESGL